MSFQDDGVLLGGEGCALEARVEVVPPAQPAALASPARLPVLLCQGFGVVWPAVSPPRLLTRPKVSQGPVV